MAQGRNKRGSINHFGGMVTTLELKQWITSLSCQQLADALHFTFVRHEDGTLHEYDLLQQMVDLECPPPTPIHPRCMGYKPATHTGATDGRCQAEQELKRRFNKPRLFQLLPRKSYYGATISNSSFSNKNHTKQQDIRKSPTKPKTTPIKWDVICKTFISPWAENLGLGATQKEREADIYLKTHTRIWKFYDDSAPVQCQLCVSLNDNKNKLLDILRVAARGRLFSQNYTKAKNTTFCAPWFKGEDEWFSLSLYLSNRFEVSLVEAYRSHRNKLNKPQPTSDLEQALNRASAHVIRQSIDQATGKAFLELLQTSDPNSNILDNPLWRIFETPTSKLTHALPNYIVSSYDPFNPKTLAQVLCSAPLVLSKQENLHFHLLVQKHLKHCLATASEKILLQAIKTSPVIASKKKKGKHKRNKERLRSTDTNPECITLPEAANESDSGDDDWVERIHPHRQCHHKPRQSPAQSISTSPTNEKTKMVVLTMVEDIIENACQLVGLIDAKDSKFEPCRPKKQGNVESYDRKSSILQYHHDSHTDCELHFNQTGSSFSHLFAQLDGSGLKDNSTEVLNCQRQSPSHLDPIYEPREPDRLLDMSAVGVSLDLSGAFDGWKGVKKFPREMSLFAEFFEEPKHYQNPVVASSTAASVASSMSDDAEVEQFVRMSDFELDSEEDGMLDDAVKSQQGGPSLTTHAAKAQALARDVMTQSPTVSTLSGSYLSTVKIDQFSKPSEGKPPTKMLSDPETSRSPRPSSPIQVSLAELGELKKKANTGELREELRRALPAIVVESAPNSPKLESIKIALTKSWSRDNLSKTPTNAVTKETQHCRRRSSSMRRSESLGEDKISRDSMPPSKETPYRQSSNPSLDRDKKCFNVTEPGSAYIPHQGNCASSVSALGDDSSLNWGEDPGLIVRSTSQGADEASISAPPPAKCHHDEREHLLREERDAFRDMCLTLGAEVSKLRNLLAAEACTHYNPVMPYGVPAPYHYYHVVPPLHPGFAPPYYNASAPGTVRVAMSDAGLTRGSEDGIDLGGRQNLHQLGDGATIGGSDVSVEFTGKTYLVAVAGAPKGDSRPDMTHGIHSRLSTDISRFLELVSLQLRKTENKRRTAISRFKRMVGVIWPRAQVKMYGSHVSNLCLPGSDLDFVICLPAVHKNAPAVTPGVLEGRNAINETWQKLLARNLKGESWIDPRTIKIIERTAVPVIKVSTKDALSKVLQLDISFDGPGHHGLEAIEMVKSMMQEFPTLRPLTLVLKQFLLDRGLLTAYTGGLSSYCLFLMITRYLQEQSSSWGDTGSLLMGFLDFFGNLFDPSTTGISVRRKQYFSRRDYVQPLTPSSSIMVDQMYTIPQNQETSPPDPFPPLDLARRHSFSSDKGEVKKKGLKSPQKLPLKSPRTRSGNPTQPFHTGLKSSASSIRTPISDPGRPCTFDPLFVEDPLNANNNVGRNAFRILQVKRAFADAHRALVASLEWDIQSGEVDDEGNLPLLKCLLHNEDAFSDIDKLNC